MNGIQGLVAIASLVAACGLASASAARPSVIPAVSHAGHDAVSVIDAGGVAVPVAHYRRIVSASTVADQMLLALVEPERLVAVTYWGASRLHDGYRLGARPQIRSLDAVEPILALKPDLVITHNYDGDQRRISRLREAGIMVFDCGPMLGWSTLEPNLRSLGALLMMPERASREITHLQRRLSAVAAGLEPGDRRRGIYVAVYGGRLYGGARGTSFHDVLTFAGLVDVAAEAGLSGWPQYDPEQLLTLDPPIVITRPGMAEALRKVPGLDRLGALASPQTAIEIDGALLEDPGYGMLPAAEAIHHAVYR